ncbi:MAG TPA: ribosomal-processing cysteine protease Prp [Lachnospiraceae bacterium]|nr:ribosomal-processing cysteine protease Prp [uncultured Lachnoclostridium sp.]HAU87402.1 ribosomal-processing cysteine protease Prp [Lachnospiraceae bacterium]
MINITVFRDDNGICNGFQCMGHAEYADYGQDIVCAAVSVLVVNTINSIEEFTDDAIACEVKEENGDVKFEFAGDISSESKLLVESMLLGLRGVEQEYGKEFIVIED